MGEWILASTSSRRIQLLKEFGLKFQCFSPEIEEVKSSGDNLPVWVAITNAQAKSSNVSEKFPDAYVIGADTIVVVDNEVFNKPKDLDEARQMLHRLSGRMHFVVTAISIVCKREDLNCLFTDTTKVYFSDINDVFIEDYLSKIQPLDKAGAYAIQHPLSKTFIKIEGSYSNVMGFPMEVFRKTLSKLNLL